MSISLVQNVTETFDYVGITASDGKNNTMCLRVARSGMHSVGSDLRVAVSAPLAWSTGDRLRLPGCQAQGRLQEPRAGVP